MLYKDPGPGKSEAVEIKVNFAMAYGDTQNFSLPIYSGNFAFKCTFSRKPVSVIFSIAYSKTDSSFFERAPFGVSSVDFLNCSFYLLIVI